MNNGTKTLVSIQDLYLYMHYLQALLSESVELMFSQYKSGMTLQEWFKYILFYTVYCVLNFINFNKQDILSTTL